MALIRPYKALKGYLELPQGLPINLSNVLILEPLYSGAPTLDSSLYKESVMNPCKGISYLRPSKRLPNSPSKASLRLLKGSLRPEALGSL